ncbi:MAG: alanine racemase [Opitutaceae bacterium]
MVARHPSGSAVRLAPASPPLRCWAEIDLAVLERNLRLIRASLPARVRYVAVVKADAYGHGLHPIAARLMHAGADLFAVANLAEAASLRELGNGWPILILSPLLPDECRAAGELNVAVTVSSAAEVDRLNKVGESLHRKLEVHLKIDTGMGRLGVWHTESAPLFAKIKHSAHLRLTGICTHFAAPDDDPEFTGEQRRRFVAALAASNVLATLPEFIHADNSSGIETFERSGPFNAVRIGLLQFGVLSKLGSLLAAVRTEPVFSLKTRVGLIKRLPHGATVSYGRTHRLARDTQVAVLCAGYADGVPRMLSNRGHVLIRGTACPILGRVTMDQTIVDVTDVPQVACSDEVVLIGRQLEASISITDFSRWAETIPWEILTSVSKRVSRVYRTALEQ